MFSEILVISHIFLCVGLIGLILIQHGKGADAGAAFGSGASATVFGSQGAASFLTRATAVLATTFFVTSLTLAYFSIQRIEPKSVIEELAPKTEVTSEIPGVQTENNRELPQEQTQPDANNEVPTTDKTPSNPSEVPQ
ncbi:MAG TPA: preprotein translocase subunit SecG [Thiotrichaceae bacterium]|nr:preprotein translocase subunit SecG [Thiotrichaceae bacterium]